MKYCTECKIEKEVKDFYKNKSKSGGLCGICKECDRIRLRIRRQVNKDTFRAKDIRYYEKNKEKIKEKRKEWYNKNRHKTSAHEKVKRALYNGTLIKQSCEVCGDKNSQAHHEDYSKPLDVMWLCRIHHMQHHYGK